MSGLIISWLVFDIIASAIILTKVIKAGFKPIRLQFPSLQRFEYFIIACILIIILTTGLIALVAPPNSFDSMNYHMSRIMHWIQDRNVAPFPTNITKQVNLTPGTEYEILQFQLLTGGDDLANMIEWFSFIGSIIGVSLIAREIGADRKGQLFSAAFCATIPIAILQASNSENHLSTAFWLVCFAYFALHAFQPFKPHRYYRNRPQPWLGNSIEINCLLFRRAIRDTHHTLGLLFQREEIGFGFGS